MNYIKNRLYAPIKIGIIFSLLTFYLFLFGVWDFPYRDSAVLIIFVLICNLVMIFGFFVGTKTVVKYRPQVSVLLTKRMFDRYIKFAFIITAITFIPRFIIDTGLYNFDFYSIFLKIQMGLSDSSMVYRMNKNVTEAVGIWSFINLICVVTGFISWLYTGLSIIIWHRMKLSRRIFTIFYWFALIIENLVQGTNFGIFDLGLQISVFYLVKKTIIRVNKRKSKQIDEYPKTKVSKLMYINEERQIVYKAKSKKKYIILAGFIILILIYYFGNVMGSRVGEYYYRLVPDGNGYVQIRMDSFLWKICPESLKSTIATLNSYISHGYMGLAMSFNVPFTSTFGIGDSWFKLFNFAQYTGIDLLPRTYQMKIYEIYGYHYAGYWHTAYLWFANDVSLFGVPIVLFVLMWIYGFAWKDFLINNNPFALLLMATFTVFFAFISANNQVFSSPNTLFAYWVMFIIWCRNRKKYDWTGVFD